MLGAAPWQDASFLTHPSRRTPEPPRLTLQVAVRNNERQKPTRHGLPPLEDSSLALGSVPASQAEPAPAVGWHWAVGEVN